VPRSKGASGGVSRAPIISRLGDCYLSLRAAGVQPDRRPATASMLATEAAALRNVNRCAQCRSDEMAGLSVIRCVPVLGLMLELLPRRLPANGCARSEPMLTFEPCHLPSPYIETPSIMLAGQRRLVMKFCHLTLA
jgi:hypothetical protein